MEDVKFFPLKSLKRILQKIGSMKTGVIMQMQSINIQLHIDSDLTLSEVEKQKTPQVEKEAYFDIDQNYYDFYICSRVLNGNNIFLFL